MFSFFLLNLLHACSLLQVHKGMLKNVGLIEFPKSKQVAKHQTFFIFALNPFTFKISWLNGVIETLLIILRRVFIIYLVYYYSYLLMIFIYSCICLLCAIKYIHEKYKFLHIDKTFYSLSYYQL